MNDDIPALATRDLTISFGGQVAVNAVTCAFRQGTLTAIVGPNGAGKTTYFNLISGQLQPSNGSVSLFGDDITRFGAPQRARRGLGRAFQLTNLYPNLSVFENVRLAVQSVAQISGRGRCGLDGGTRGHNFGFGCLSDRASLLRWRLGYRRLDGSNARR